MNSIILAIDYDEQNQDTYKAVIVSGVEETNGKRRFELGDVERDWRDAIRYITDNFKADRHIAILCSSSVDHFVMDGDKYKFDEEEMYIIKA